MFWHTSLIALRLICIMALSLSEFHEFLVCIIHASSSCACVLSRSVSVWSVQG